MFKNVLVGVDGRPSGRDAVALASRLTDPSGKLTLAHVHSGELHPSHIVTPALAREERTASQRLLETERAACDVQAELVSIVSMSPGGGLHRQAEEQNVDLLVVGSCSHGLFGRAMLGDDTRACLNGAPCAVAIAAVGFGADPKPLTRIGVAYNGSPESTAALAQARELARPGTAEIRALEVVSIPTYAYTGLMAPAIGDSIDVVLQEAVNRMHELSDVDGSAVYGLAGEELAAFGEELDLLIVGSRGYGPVKRLILGSTSNFLERHARCSLLVLPRGHAGGSRDTYAGALSSEASVGASA